MNVATLSLLTTRKACAWRGCGHRQPAGRRAGRGAACRRSSRTGVGLERDADRQALRRAVADVEAPVVLGALDERALDQAVGQVRVAVGADAVGGVEVAVGGAVDGVGAAARGRSGSRLRFAAGSLGADLDPAVDEPACPRAVIACAACGTPPAGPWAGQRAAARSRRGLSPGAARSG